MTLAPEGRKLIRIEARNAEVPIERKPEWIKTKAHMGPEYTRLQSLVKSEGLHTVCQEAACPNIFECWEDKEATFLIGGDKCTRRCDFCNIDTGKPLAIDRAEPFKVAMSVKTMGLRYATITGVTRDDLEDEGSWQVVLTNKNHTKRACQWKESPQKNTNQQNVWSGFVDKQRVRGCKDGCIATEKTCWIVSCRK